MVKECTNCLNNWGIIKVFALTVDNVASNGPTQKVLKEYLLEKRDVCAKRRVVSYEMWSYFKFECER